MNSFTYQLNESPGVAARQRQGLVEFSLSSHMSHRVDKQFLGLFQRYYFFVVVVVIILVCIVVWDRGIGAIVFISRNILTIF